MCGASAVEGFVYTFYIFSVDKTNPNTGPHEAWPDPKRPSRHRT